jgi:lysophospholipase L1-like esterase
MRRRTATALVVAALTAAFSPLPPASAGGRPVVAIIGDSYTAGWSSQMGYGSNPVAEQRSAWWNYTADAMGWTVGGVIANPGAGYVKAGMFGSLPDSVARFLRTIPPGADYVLIQGGLNDDSDSAAIPAGVARVISLVHRQAPHAVPIVIGAFNPYPRSLRYPNSLGVARSIGNWQAIGATRYTIGFMCTFQTDADGLHPSSAGQREIGSWVAWHLQNGLDNGTPLKQDSAGGYWTA